MKHAFDSGAKTVITELCRTGRSEAHGMCAPVVGTASTADTGLLQCFAVPHEGPVVGPLARWTRHGASFCDDVQHKLMPQLGRALVSNTGL